MSELVKKIVDAKNERERLKGDIVEAKTKVRILQAELIQVEHSIDVLNDLNKTK